MRIALVYMQNNLLLGGISHALKERGEILVEHVTKAEDLPQIAKTLGAFLVLMEISKAPQHSFLECMAIVQKIRLFSLPVKIAFLVDENSDTAMAEQCKEAKKEGQIDAFFYASVSGEYLSAALDSL